MGKKVKMTDKDKEIIERLVKTNRTFHESFSDEAYEILTGGVREEFLKIKSLGCEHPLDAMVFLLKELEGKDSLMDECLREIIISVTVDVMVDGGWENAKAE